MPEIRLDITTTDAGAIAALLGTNRARSGEQFPVADGVSVGLAPIQNLQEAAGAAVINLVIMMAAGVPPGVVAAYLYDKLTGRSITKLRINRRVTELDAGEITRVIEETIEAE